MQVGSAAPIPSGRSVGVSMTRLLFSGLGAAVAALLLLPLLYLVLRASEADLAQVVALLWRRQILDLLANTAALTAGVLVLSTVLALPLAWLVSRTNLTARRWLNLLAVLPWPCPAT